MVLVLTFWSCFQNSSTGELPSERRRDAAFLRLFIDHGGHCTGHRLDGATRTTGTAGTGSRMMSAAPACRPPTYKLTGPVVWVYNIRVEVLFRVPVVDAWSARPNVTWLRDVIVHFFITSGSRLHKQKPRKTASYALCSSTLLIHFTLDVSTKLNKFWYFALYFTFPYTILFDGSEMKIKITCVKFVSTVVHYDNKAVFPWRLRDALRGVAWREK